MKKQNAYPKLVYHDENSEIQLRAEFQSAKEALQKLLDTWNNLIDIPFKSLFQLAYDPRTVYSDLSNKDAKELPIELITAAYNVRNQVQAGHPELWSIEDNKTVILNENLVNDIIHKNDIIAENENQEHFAILCTEYVKCSHELNEALKGIQTMRMPLPPFQPVSRSFPYINELQFFPDQLRLILKNM